MHMSACESYLSFRAASLHSPAPSPNGSVSQKWTAIRIVNGSEASEPPCQLNAACRADLASQCVRYMSLQEKCVSVPSSYFLILAIVGLLAVACVAVTSYICYFKWYKPGAPGLNGRYIFC